MRNSYKISMVFRTIIIRRFNSLDFSRLKKFLILFFIYLIKFYENLLYAAFLNQNATATYANYYKVL